MMSKESRIDKIKHIRSAFLTLNDDQVNSIYDSFTKDIEDDEDIDVKKSRRNKLKYIIDNFEFATDGTINALFDRVKKCNDLNENIKKKSDNVKNKNIDKKKISVKVKKKDIIKEDVDEDDDYVDENSKKYKIVLKFVNGLLENSDIKPINKLTQFADVDRNDIVTDTNKEYIEEIAGELFPLFDKRTCRYYPKKSKSRPLNILRGVVNDLGYNFAAARKEVFKGNDRVSTMIYTIRPSM